MYFIQTKSPISINEITQSFVKLVSGTVPASIDHSIRLFAGAFKIRQRRSPFN